MPAVAACRAALVVLAFTLTDGAHHSRAIAAGDAGAPKPTDASSGSASAPASNKGRQKAPAPLCDDHWDGGFITIQIREEPNDGRIPRAYRPQYPDERWELVGGQHLVERNHADKLYTVLGKFRDRAEAKKFLRRVETEPQLLSMIDRRQPPGTTSPGPFLVSSNYTCTIDRDNERLEYADWILERSGYLIAGVEGACVRGRKKKTVTIVDCSGSRNLITDTWTSGCDASPIRACIFEMSPGVFGIQQDYSASEEGRQLSFRIYDPKTKKRLFAMREGYDRTEGPDSFTDVVDLDRDGIPELSRRDCDAGDCVRVEARKWNGRRFDPIPLPAQLPQGQKQPPIVTSGA